MAHAIRIHETGGPEVMRWEEVAVGQPGPGEVRLSHVAVGLNFADTYFRSGLYPMPLPGGRGSDPFISASSGSHHKAHGFAGGVLTIPGKRR